MSGLPSAARHIAMKTLEAFRPWWQRQDRQKPPELPVGHDECGWHLTAENTLRCDDPPPPVREMPLRLKLASFGRALSGYRLERESVKAGKYRLAGMFVHESKHECLICDQYNRDRGTAFRTIFDTRLELHFHVLHHHSSNEGWRVSCHCGARVNILEPHDDCFLSSTRCGICNTIFEDADQILSHIAREHGHLNCNWTIAQIVLPSDPTTSTSVMSQEFGSEDYRVRCGENVAAPPVVAEAAHYSLDYFRRSDEVNISHSSPRLIAQEKHERSSSPPPWVHQEEEVEDLIVGETAEELEYEVFTEPPAEFVDDVDYEKEGYCFFLPIEDKRNCTFNASDFAQFNLGFTKEIVTLSEIVRATNQYPSFVAAIIAIGIQTAIHQAQSRETIFAHMQTRQLVNLARDAPQRRKILRTLMFEERYWEKGSKFLSVCEELKLKKIPVFSKSRNLVDIVVPTDVGPKTIIIGIDDCPTAWLRQTISRQVLRAEGLFDFTMKHTVDSHLGSQVSEFFDKCTETLEKLGLAANMLQTFASIGLKVIAAAVAGFKWEVCAVLFLDFLLTYGVSSALIKTCLDVVSKSWNSILATCGFGNAAQSDDHTTTTITALVVVLGACMLGKFPTGAKLAGMVGGIKLLGDFSRGLKSSWTFIYEMVSKCIDALSTWYYGVPCDISELSKYAGQVTTWYADVMELTKVDIDNEIKTNPQLCNKIAALYRTGLEISVGMRHVSVPKHLLTGFNTHFAHIKELYRRASTSGAFDTGARIEPVVIHLSGASGIGKSGLTPFIAAAMLSIDGVGKTEDGKDDIMREVYYRSTTQEFWDGYYGQRIVVYDDFGQRVDSSSNPNPEFEEIIRTGNVSRYPLHMADLADKDNTNFVSRVVICTSNQAPENLQIRSLNTPQAVKRRLENCYAVSIDDNVCREVTHNGVTSQRLDKNLVEQVYGVKKTVAFYKFHKINPETNEIDPLPIRFDVLIKRLKDDYVRKSQDFADTMRWIEAAYTTGIDDTVVDNGGGRIPPPMIEVQLDEATRMAYDLMQEIGLEAAVAEDPLVAQIEGDIYHDFDVQRWLVDQGPAYWVENPANRLLLAQPALEIVNVLDVADELVDYDRQMQKWDKLETVVPPAKVTRCVDDLFRSELISAGVLRTSEGKSLWRTCQLYIASFKHWCTKMLDKITVHIGKHFKWYAAFSALAIVVGLYKFQRYEEQLTLEDASHSSLESEERHAHKCEACKRICSHTHGPVGPEEALTKVLLCTDCAKDTTVTAYMEMKQDKDGKDRRTYKFVCHYSDGRNVTINKISDLEEYLARANECVSVTTIAELAECIPSLAGRSAQSIELEGRKVVRLTEAGTIRPKKVVMDLYTGKIAENSANSPGPQSRRRQRLRRVQEHDMTKTVLSDEKPIFAQVANDPGSMDIANKALKNTYLISAITPTGSRYTTRGVFITGRVMLTVYHMRRHIVPGNKLHVRNVRIKDGWTIPCEMLKTVEVLGPDGNFVDQLLMEFPKSVPMHCDLTNSIADSETMARFNEVQAGLCVAVDKDTAVIRTGKVVARHDVTYVAQGNAGEVNLTIRKAYEYDGLQNNEGDCGSPLVAMQSTIVKKIIGLHVCGAYGVGYSTALNMVHIRAALRKFENQAQICFEPEKFIDYVEELDNENLPEGNFLHLGRVSKFISGPPYTKLRPSVVNGILAEPTMAPARLKAFKRDDEIVSPIDLSLKKAGITPPTLDESILDVVTPAVCTAVNNFGSEEYRRVLSDDEMIQGLGEHLAPVCRTTSAGYPWVLSTNGKPGKTKWLGQDEYMYHQEVRDAVDSRIAAASEGIRVPAVWVDTLKDEKRPIPKVEQGKTRTISAGPIDFTLAFRKYFGGFAAHCVKHRISNEISVGTNMLSPAEVKKLRDHVLSRGDRVIAGDFSNYDGTLCPQILYRALEVIEDFYRGPDIDKKIRAVLFEEIVNSVHLKRDTLYMWTHSQPSGNPLTSFLNSLYNSISIRYVWMKVAPEGMRNMLAFRNNVAMQSYGDDNLIGVSRACDFFNQVAITEGYTHLNMVYTMECKTGDIIPFRDISEVSYLKRSFRLNEDGFWVAPLDLDTILEMGMWVHGDTDPIPMCVSNCATALRELVLHGREVYDRESARFREAARATFIPLEVMTYDGAYDDWKAGALLTVDLEIGAGVDCRVTPAAKPVPKPVAIPSGEDIDPQIADNLNNDNQEFSLEAKELISFRDDETPQSVTPANHTASWYDWSNSRPAESDLKSVLARPIPVWTGTMTSTSTFSQAYDLPSIWMNSSPNLKTKLANYTFLKGTICVKLMANATPFQCGKYWMYYVPYSAQGMKYPYTEDLSHITGYPGVELDLASAKSAELKIPLVGPYNMIDLVNKVGKYGDLFIHQLAQISDGTSAASCGASVYMWMEDAELVMPTGAPNLYAQGKNEATTASRTGLISGFASKVSGLADSVGKAFPSLSGYTAPLSWVAGVTSGVASYFGFSKPMNLETSTCVYNVPAKGFTNGSGVDNGVVLGTFPDNAVDQSVGPLGTDVDEMSLSYVCSRMCIDETFPWKNDQAEGSLLWSQRVFAERLRVGQDRCPTIMDYVAMLFRYWGGSIKYKLSFAKTAFHTGRLKLVYRPKMPDGTTELYNNDVYSWIVDLSETSEITFTIPYVSNKPWLEINDYNGILYIYVLTPLNVSSEAASPSIQGLLWKCGGPDFRLAVPDKYMTTRDWPEINSSKYVQPRLKAQIHVETAAPVQTSDDSNMFMPYGLTDPIQASMATMGESVVSLRTLAKRFTALCRVVTPKARGPDGEHYFLFPSLRAFPFGIRLNPYYFGNSVGTEIVQGRIDFDGIDDEETAIFAIHKQSLLSCISQLYRFARGSTRFKYLAAQPSSVPDLSYVRPTLRASLGPNVTAVSEPVLLLQDCTSTQYQLHTNYQNSFGTVVQPDNGTLEFTVPQFTPTPCVLATNGDASGYGAEPTSTAINLVLSDGFMPAVAPNAPDGERRKCFLRSALSWFPPGTLLQAAGEDFTFSFLGGAPRVSGLV